METRFAFLSALFRSAAVFYVALMVAAPAEVFGQSARRKLTGRVAPSPSMRQYLANPPHKDIDLYVGRIVRKDGEFVIVSVTSPNAVRGRTPMYYACDAKMNPTAILQNMKVSHRSCSTFKTLSGTALVGDVVMVKYLSPESQPDK